MLSTKSFKGVNVFMSRNLVPPEVFDALLDALKLNGADVFLCCDPSRHGHNDFHIISSPDHVGDKYKVARRWGHIHIVTRKWFDQSVASKACLNEESYPVQGGFLSSSKTLKGPMIAQQSQDKCIGNLFSVPSSVVSDSNLPATPHAGSSDPDLEATLSQNMSSMFSDPPVSIKVVDCDKPMVKETIETNLDGCVADDSQSEDSDMYLSECRISLVGFEAPDLRKLVNMVRRGGGSRYMTFNDKLTHIIVGAPTENCWLEDCDREKKEIPVLCQHIAYDLLLPKDPVSSLKGTVTGMTGNQAKSSSIHPSIHSDQLLGSANSGLRMPSLLKENRDVEPEMNINLSNSMEGTVRWSQPNVLPVANDLKKGAKRMQNDCCDQDVQRMKSINVFKGKTFCFSKSFPEDRVLIDKAKQKVHFMIECHGVISRSADDPWTRYVSSHWVRSCLEGGCLLDIGSHIIYSPLPCRIPLPGFEKFRFCISQYEEKDRLLLRNLCFVLGAKFVEKLTRKVTHLLCKFTSGPKHDAACKWDICLITSEWIYECVRQNDVVAVDQFRPKEITSQDQEAGLCTVSQFPTQDVQMISGENANSSAHTGGSLINSFTEEAHQSIAICKKAKFFKDDDQKSLLLSRVHLSDSTCNTNSTEDDNAKVNGESTHDIPDVAAAIEDLLEQTSKIQDQKSPGRSGCDKSLFSSDCSMLGEGHGGSPPVIGLPKHWLSRTGRRDELSSPKEANEGLYDNFSETQTDSQVLALQPLTGRQMLIDRVRTRSSMA
ncbi:BRCT domain-containing family protein [Salix suchowensis]|nr:BRCT domain-containing family protein [Salix suchowensis]